MEEKKKYRILLNNQRIDIFKFVYTFLILNS